MDFEFTSAHVFAAITCVFATVFILCRVNKSIMRSLVFKTLSGLGFVATGLIAMYISNKHSPYALLCVFGLVFGLIGDVFMQFKYCDRANYRTFLVMGMAFFGLGHFFYFAALYTISTFSFYPFIGALVMTIVAFIAFRTKRFEKIGKLKFVGCTYYFFLSVILFQSIFAYVYHESMQTLFFLVGASFFFVSDTVLSFIYFGGANRRRFTVLNLTTYYIAQLAIALSILYI